jgi:hypothetical protein
MRMSAPKQMQTQCRRSDPGFFILVQVHSLVRPVPRAFFPDRQIWQPPRAGPVKAGRVFAAKGSALTGHRSGSPGPPPQPEPRCRAARSRRS